MKDRMDSFVASVSYASYLMRVPNILCLGRKDTELVKAFKAGLRRPLLCWTCLEGRCTYVDCALIWIGVIRLHSKLHKMVLESNQKPLITWFGCQWWQEVIWHGGLISTVEWAGKHIYFHSENMYCVDVDIVFPNQISGFTF